MLQSAETSPEPRAASARPACVPGGGLSASQAAGPFPRLPGYDPLRLERAPGLPAALPILTVIRLLLAMSLPRL